MHFVKMHGIGNDYIYIDAHSRADLEQRFTGPGGTELVRRMSDRHTGIGGDGVILVCRPTSPLAHARMRMFNADGSQAEMCGNGVRCVAKFAHDRLGVRASPMVIDTARGPLTITYVVRDGRLAEAAVDMGAPSFELAAIPVDPAHVSATEESGALIIDTPHETIRLWAASMGNPHVVVPCADPAAVDLAAMGPLLERHPAFPARTNVHLAAWRGAAEVVMRTWERGAGETRACGTGACAVVAVGARFLGMAADALVHLPGGDLRIAWDRAAGPIVMTGPAEDVFEGVWPGDAISA